MKFAHLLAALGIASMATVSAHAAPITLNFEGIGNGAEILDFYNGGTDSYGNSGVNYGVRFSRGAIAQQNGEGVYLKEGNFSLTFSSALGDNGQPGFNGSAHGSIFTFLYSATPPVGSIAVADVVFDSGFRDISNPYTPTGSNRFVGSSLTGTEPINTITFLNMAIDNFTFGPSAIPADRLRSNDIPEPATLALLGIGALGLIAARKKQAA